tara:strand:- start:4 stop:168 length:165 start_codon:yes stop_codon:yes gene_type:complete
MGNLFCKRQKDKEDEDCIDNDIGIQRHSQYKQRTLNVINVHVEEMEKYTWLPAI